MPVRTSAVVAGGLVLLTLVGVTTIFGESLLALVAPPTVDGITPAPGGGAPASGKPGSPGNPTGAATGASPSPAVAAGSAVPAAASTGSGGAGNEPHRNP